MLDRNIKSKCRNKSYNILSHFLNIYFFVPYIFMATRMKVDALQKDIAYTVKVFSILVEKNSIVQNLFVDSTHFKICF